MDSSSTAADELCTLITTLTISGAYKAAATELDSRIHSLPQELQDQIKDLLLRADLPSSLGPTTIEMAYKPPLGLVLDAKTREKFAKKLYKNIVFQVCEDLLQFWPSSPNPLFAVTQVHSHAMLWLSSLSKPHRRFIESIQYNIVEKQVQVIGRPSPSISRVFDRECQYCRECINEDRAPTYLSPGMLSIKAQVVYAPVQLPASLRSTETEGEREDEIIEYAIFREPA